jgi:hypothetical protein
MAKKAAAKRKRKAPAKKKGVARRRRVAAKKTATTRKTRTAKRKATTTRRAKSTKTRARTVVARRRPRAAATPALAAPAPAAPAPAPVETVQSPPALPFPGSAPSSFEQPRAWASPTQETRAGPPAFLVELPRGGDVLRAAPSPVTFVACTQRKYCVANSRAVGQQFHPPSPEPERPRHTHVEQ